MSCPHKEWAYLFELESSIPFYFLTFPFILNPCTSSFTPSTTLTVATYCTPPERLWTPLTTPTSSEVMSPTSPTSWKLTSSPTQSLTHPHFSEQGLLDDVGYDDTALEDMLREAHRAHVYQSQREGLSVGQSSSSVSERTERSGGERAGRPVEPIGHELNVANAQIRTLLDTERAKSRRMPSRS